MVVIWAELRLRVILEELSPADSVLRYQFLREREISKSHLSDREISIEASRL